MKVQLPNELIMYVFEYYNPYKILYKNNVIDVLKSKSKYNIVMRQLRLYSVHNRGRELIYFSIDSILGKNRN